MEDILEKVKSFADRSHGEQKRKYSGERYIVHPVRVMEMCREYTHSLPVLAAALLHDVLEDTEVTKEEMLRFLNTAMDRDEAVKTTELVEELTDVYTTLNYPRLNRRKRRQKEAERLSVASKEAQTVKYADLIDNSIDITRNDRDFAPVFLSESKNLLEKMNKGNPELYKRAVETVKECILEIEKE